MCVRLRVKRQMVKRMWTLTRVCHYSTGEKVTRPLGAAAGGVGRGGCACLKSAGGCGDHTRAYFRSPNAWIAVGCACALRRRCSRVYRREGGEEWVHVTL